MTRWQLCIGVMIGTWGLLGNGLHASVATDALGGPRDQDKTGKGSVSFTISSQHTSRISPWIYGANAVGTFKGFDKSLNLTFYRLGGNRLSAYNWENNLSHAGSDYRYQNDTWLCGQYGADCSQPGGVVKAFGERAFGLADGILVTVPNLSYVAKTSSDGDVCQTKPTKTAECPNRKHLQTLFVQSKANKGKKLSLKPNLKDDAVYQDEFVHWTRQAFAGALKAGKAMFYSMDNEPALWGITHNRIRPYGEYCKHNPTYPEVLQRNIEYATAVKKQTQALVFGPAHYGWMSLMTLQNFAACTGHEKTPFYEFYLQGLQKARKQNGGQHLVDVWDLHWYPEARTQGKGGARITSDKVDEKISRVRVQAPRSLWDPNFNEGSWITEDSLKGDSLRLIPRLRAWVAKYNPGMGLAITEYTFGGEHHISGGIAQADALGIYGREGLFAATFWPLAQQAKGSAYIKGAFRMYRNYDGQGGTFGDVAVSAVSDSISRASVYASTFAANPKRLVVVAINKTASPLPAEIKIQHRHRPAKAKAYVLSAKSAKPAAGGPVKLKKSGEVAYKMPPLSVSTLVFEAP